MEAQRGGPDVVIRLSYAEAVVLDALLHRWERDGVLDAMTFEDQAEERVLWDLTATFEPLIDEVFDPDAYSRTLARSRTAVRDDEHPPPDPP